MRVFFAFWLCLSILSACNRTKTTPVQKRNVEETPSHENISRITGILDHYDDVFKVTSEFQLDVFVDGGVVESSTGRHEYSRGEEKWLYMKNGEVVKIVECYVDRALVRVPHAKSSTQRKKGKEKKDESVFDVVSEYQAKYPCAMQALVRYNSELKGNKLEHDGKVYVVNAVDEEARTVTKVSLHKNNRIQVYTFSNIRFEEPLTEEPASETPAKTDPQEPTSTEPPASIEGDDKKQ